MIRALITKSLPIRWLDLADTRKPVSAVVPLAFTAIALALGYQSVLDSYQSSLSIAGDFHFLLNAGKIILDAGGALYSAPDHREWFQQYGYGFVAAYPYPPAVAYLTSILTVLSDDTALQVFRVCIALSTAFLAFVVSRGFMSRAWRVAIFAALLLWQPMLLNALIGQTGAFVAALFALGIVVYMRNRLLGAAVLGLIGLKPTAAIAAGLIVWPDRPRAWAIFAGVALLLVFVPFLWLGRRPLGVWWDTLYSRGVGDLAGGHVYNQGLSSLVNFQNLPGVLLLILLVAVVLASVRLVRARLGLEMGVAFALMTGFLINPHSLLYDWGVAFIAIFLIRKSQLLPEHLADFGCGVLVISLFLVGQWGWASVSETYVSSSLAVNPVTVWALVLNLGILGLAVRSYLLERRGRSLTVLEPVPAARPSRQTSA